MPDRHRHTLCRSYIESKELSSSKEVEEGKFRYGGSEALRAPYSDVVGDGGERSAGLRDRELFRTVPLCTSKHGSDTSLSLIGEFSKRSYPIVPS